MLTVKSSEFKHNPKVITSLLTKKGNSIVTTRDMRILFPDRYVARDLAILGSTVSVISMVAILDSKNNYGVLLTPITMVVSPSNIEDMIIDGKLYKVLVFEAGDIVVPNTLMVMNEDFMYSIFDEFYVKGNIPWFISYDMLSDLFTESKKYAGSSIGNDIVAFEILTATIARSTKDKYIQHRQIIKSPADKSAVEYVGLNNVFYSYVNTGAKIIGSYYGTGVTAAAVVPEKESTKLVDLLRA